MTKMLFEMGMLFLGFLLVIGIIVCKVMLRARTERETDEKTPLIVKRILTIALVAAVLFYASHSTYYLYNDWAILNHSVYDVQERYGDFDLGKISDGHAGTVAYYIYHDDSPIMPDHLDHYYYMEYDENGIIYKVFDGCAPGG